MIENNFYHDLIDSLTAALVAKDYYTAGHSTRVGDMSYKLGKFLNLDSQRLEILHIAGHLHDIGKIGIPDNILHKKGKLTNEEWNIMKKHSSIGYNILRKSQSLSYISKIVLHHHEKFDGTGYPSSLKGKDIPYESRIIAACDSIDAMKSIRPYKRIMTDDECIQELVKNKSIMYDPEIIDCLLYHWDDIVTITYANDKIYNTEYINSIEENPKIS
ncbi:MAG TPA: phosphohydrolase [Clostridium sp.]|nr:phosphohydrolase [Clostridium sp.]